MRFIISFTLILFILNIPINAKIENGDITGIGYGYVSDVYGPDAVGINPSFLSDISGEWFSVSLIKPFIFHNISFAFGINRNFGLGFHLMQDENFNLYSTAFGINMSDFINLGAMFSLQRETVVDDKVNFSFSPGLNFSLKTYRRETPFDIRFGLFAENLIAGDNLSFYKDYSELDIVYGLSFRILLEELRFYFGGEYFDNKNHISFSADYRFFRVMNLRFGLSSEKDVLLGLKLGNNYNHLSVGSRIHTEPSGIFYSISYTRSITVSVQRKQVRSIKRVSRRTLNRQKELIDSGLNYYREKDYINARKEWRKAYRLAPESKYGKEARKYLQRVERILKQIGE